MDKTHIVLDAYDIPDKVFIDLDDNKYEDFNAFVLQTLHENGMTVIDHVLHDFKTPAGAFTSIYLLAESHLSFHSFPENSYIAVDCFTCGKGNTKKIIESIIAFLKPSKNDQIKVNRGKYIKHQ